MYNRLTMLTERLHDFSLRHIRRAYDYHARRLGNRQRVITAGV